MCVCVCVCVCVKRNHIILNSVPTCRIYSIYIPIPGCSIYCVCVEEEALLVGRCLKSCYSWCQKRLYHALMWQFGHQRALENLQLCNHGISWPTTPANQPATPNFNSSGMSIIVNLQFPGKTLNSRVKEGHLELNTYTVPNSNEECPPSETTFYPCSSPLPACSPPL